MKPPTLQLWATAAAFLAILSSPGCETVPEKVDACRIHRHRAEQDPGGRNPYLRAGRHSYSHSDWAQDDCCSQAARYRESVLREAQASRGSQPVYESIVPLKPRKPPALVKIKPSRTSLPR